jgi:hypothetical protein
LNLFARISCGERARQLQERWLILPILRVQQSSSSRWHAAGVAPVFQAILVAPVSGELFVATITG